MGSETVHSAGALAIAIDPHMGHPTNEQPSLYLQMPQGRSPLLPAAPQSPQPRGGREWYG